jgi:Mannosyl-glycoprotein endo-beta-N-acetylglucosaminidase/LysM domain
MLARFIVKTFFLGAFCLTSLQVSANKKLTENYISAYKNIAVAEMRRTGIPASIKLAQGILESDLGRSPLAFKANNHFGIKCGRDWSGDTYFKHDDETDSDGSTIESCFRAYTDAEESYLAHSEFLTLPSKQSRYGFLFDLGTTDYVGWANGLKFSGYATDPSYPTKLIKIIESYKLYEFDEPITMAKKKNDDLLADNTRIPEKTHQEKQKDNNTDRNNKVDVQNESKAKTKHKSSGRYATYKINDVKTVRATGGESVRELAIRVGKNVYDLMEYNEGITSQDHPLLPNEIVYLERKKKSYQAEENAFHTVEKGETMYDIAQKYGVRLESLLSKNNLESNAIPLKGELISLQKNLSKRDTPKHHILEKFDTFVDMGELK